MATSAKAAGTQVIGKAFIVYGTVKAIAPDGTVRILGPNSEIYADERIVTESDGGVSLMLDGPPPSQIDIGRMSDVLMNEDVYAGAPPEAVTDASADAEKIQEALEGQGDIEIDATAAGAGGAGGGMTLVQFGLDGSEGNVTSGAETTGYTQDTVEPLDAILAADDSPTGGIDVAAVDEDGLSYNTITDSSGNQDGALGDHPAVDSFITGNLTYNFGNDGPAAVNPFVWSMDGLEAMGETSQGHELLYEVVDGGLTLNAYYLVEGKYEVNYPGEDSGGRVEVFSVTVTDVTTGAYTFTLYQPLDHAEAGTEDDILYNFTYTLTDGNGSTGTGSLGMTIDDDSPVLAGPGEDVSTNATNGSGINTVLEVHAGDVVTFSWSFDADDYTPFNDFGFVVIDGVATKLVDISQVGSYNATGWATFTYVATADGPLTIGFGVMNTGDSGVDSHLLIDKLAVNGEVVQSFESGDLSGWSSAGAAYVVTSHDEGGGTPTDGSYMVRLTSSSDVYEGALEAFFGLPEGAMDAVSNTGAAGSGSDTVMVEDEKMPGGIDENDGGVGSVTGTIVDNVKWGADGFGSATEFSVGEQTFVAGTTVYWAQDGTFLGENIDGPDAAASLLVNSDGTYTYTLLDNMLLGQDIQGEQIDTLATVSITGVDGDGDPISVPVILNVQDDVPMLMGEDGGQLYSSDTVTVEDEKMQDWAGRLFTDEHDGGVGHVTGTIVDNVNWGADGFGSATTFSVDGQTFDVGTMVYWAQDGEFLGTNVGEDSGQPAASLLVNSDGTYTFTLLDNMLLGQDIQGEQIDLLDTVTITAQDADGDTVDVNVNLQVQDDQPFSITLPDIVIAEDEMTMGDGVDVVTGTIVNNAIWGADGFGEAATFSVDGQTFAAGTTVYWDQSGNFLGTNAGEDSGEPAASMLVNSDGTYTFTLLDNMLISGHDDQINLLDKVTITGEDADGDKVDVDVYLKVQDDVPSIHLHASSESSVLLTTQDAETDGVPTDFDTAISTANFGGVFSIASSSYGADGPGSTAMSYSLDLKHGVKDSGMNSDGHDINLYKVGNDIIGSTSSNSGGVNAGNTVFSLAVDSSGVVTLTQYQEIDHSNNNDTSAPYDDQFAVLGNNLVKLTGTATITDGDGDTDTDSETIDLGGNIKFADDGPSVSSNNIVVVDDDDVADASGNAGGTGDDAPAFTSGTLGHDFGADGAGSIAWTNTGAPAGFTYVKSGDSLLVKQGDTTVMTLTLNTSTGAYAVTQNAPIDHASGADENNQEFTINYEVKDGDGDKASGTLTISVDDDTPTIDVSSAVTYTVDVTNYGDTSAGYDNSFGYYIKGAGGIPTTGVVVWDNVKNFVNGSVEITGYTPDQVGFFIIPNGNNYNSLDANTAVTFELDGSGHWQAVTAGGIHLTGEGANVLFDVAALNIDHYDHVVDNAYPGNLNWEDIAGGGDHDFNDINIGVVWSSNLPVLTTQDAETIGPATDTASASFSGIFSVAAAPGADGGTPTTAYSLNVTNADSGLTSDGDAIVLSKVGNDVVGTADGNEVFRISVDANGTVTLTQYAELDHVGEGADGNAFNNSANMLGLADGKISLTATATIIDGDGDQASDSQSLDISGSFHFQDDIPTAVNIERTTAGSDVDTNLMITLDISGSMGSYVTIDGHSMTRLDAAKESIEKLIDAYDAKGDVMVKLVAFSGDYDSHIIENPQDAFEAGNYDGRWLTADEAKDALEALSPTNYTNYDAGLDAAMKAFADTGKIGGAQNISYFLSDGEPNDGGGITTNGTGEQVSISEWTSFVDANNIVSFALGMGTGANLSALSPIAYNGAATPNVDTTAILVDDFGDLTQTLVGTVVAPPVSGNLLTGSTPDGSFGADGGHVQGITGVGGGSATSDDTSSVAQDGYDLHAHGKYGGTLDVDSNTGDYLYTPPTSVPAGDVTETFTFTLIDGDGDMASAQLSILIDDPNNNPT